MDTWVGTLSVPGLEFDVSPPILQEIVNSTLISPYPRAAEQSRAKGRSPFQK